MQQSVKKILADLIDHLEEEGLYDWSDAKPLPQLPYSKLTTDYYDYDRGRFIGELGGSSRNGISVYDEILEGTKSLHGSKNIEVKCDYYAIILMDLCHQMHLQPIL